MKMFKAVAHALMLASALGASAAAIADPIQYGRLSRNSIAQDWSGGETYPGVINPTVAYHYHTYVIDVGLTNYLQIDFDSVPANTFISAYQTSYDPTNPGSTWLGDPGTSGNYFGTDPLYFQVTALVNSVVVLVVNDTSATNGGLGPNNAFHVTVDGFTDSGYDDYANLADFTTNLTPEPSTVLLMLGALAGMIALNARRRRGPVAPPSMLAV